MALILIDTHFRQGQTSAAAPVQPAPIAQAVKRPRADSSTSYESGSESGLPIRLSLGSGLPHASKHRPVVSTLSRFSPEAAVGAAATAPLPGAPVAVMGPLAAPAAEHSHNQPRATLSSLSYSNVL
jgi:hypothetical protein